LVDEARSFNYADNDRTLEMFDGSRKIYLGDWISKDDLSEFSKMSRIEKNYVRPHSLKICSNDERIFGLQLTLHMFRAVFPNEDEIVDEYGD
jgi:hypothetical protein